MKFEMKECPNDMLFGVNFFDSEKCIKCQLCLHCELTKNKYKIKNENEDIPLSRAKDFIFDVWGRTWSYPDLIKRNAEKYGLLNQKKLKNYNLWTISYKNIYILMNTPLWKSLYMGRLHGR